MQPHRAAACTDSARHSCGEGYCRRPTRTPIPPRPEGRWFVRCAPVSMDTESLQLLEDGLRKTMTTASGQRLDAALAELGWLEMLDEMPEAAVPLVFRLLGETSAHAPVLNDVVLRAAGREGGGTIPLRYTGDSWVLWARTGEPSSVLGDDLPIHPVGEGDSAPMGAGRHALGWWLVGAGRAMLALARQHA